MIYSLRGKIAYKQMNYVVVECAGVGFKASISLQTASKLPAAGEDVFLLTHMAVKEDSVDLFGFADEGEMNCFVLLTSVSGVGPKVGLAILSNLTPDKVALAVVGGDYKMLTAAQGVGPKLAQRIVLELKDKMKNALSDADSFEGFSPADTTSGSPQGEAVNALVVLGYTPGEAAAAISKLGDGLAVEEYIKGALKGLSKRR